MRLKSILLWTRSLPSPFFAFRFFHVLVRMREGAGDGLSLTVRQEGSVIFCDTGTRRERKPSTPSRKDVSPALNGFDRAKGSCVQTRRSCCEGTPQGSRYLGVFFFVLCRGFCLYWCSWVRRCEKWNSPVNVDTWVLLFSLCFLCLFVWVFLCAKLRVETQDLWQGCLNWRHFGFHISVFAIPSTKSVCRAEAQDM